MPLVSKICPRSHLDSATFIRADAREVDLRKKTVVATTGSDASGMELELSYDKLVVAVGTQPNWFGIPGVKENGLFLKEAEDSAKLHARLLNNLEKASALSYQEDKYHVEIDRLLKIVVVGGGPTGKTMEHDRWLWGAVPPVMLIVAGTVTK